MKKLIAMILALILALSLAGCGAKAEEPTEEEYLDWLQRTWDLVYEAYEDYSFEFRNAIALIYYEEGGKKICPSLEFLLKDDLKKLSEEEVKLLKALGYFNSESQQEDIQLARRFIHEIIPALQKLVDERSAYSSIPEDYTYVDSKIVEAANIILNWGNAIIQEIKNGATGREIFSNVDSLDSYGIDEEVYERELVDTSGLDVYAGIEARRNARIAAGGIEGHIEILEVLLG